MERNLQEAFRVGTHFFTQLVSCKTKVMTRIYSIGSSTDFLGDMSSQIVDWLLPQLSDRSMSVVWKSVHPVVKIAEPNTLQKELETQTWYSNAVEWTRINLIPSVFNSGVVSVHSNRQQNAQTHRNIKKEITHSPALTRILSDVRSLLVGVTLQSSKHALIYEEKKRFHLRRGWSKSSFSPDDFVMCNKRDGFS